MNLTPSVPRETASTASSAAAAKAINTLGLELLAKGTKVVANALLSPYSIQSALAMAFAGAAGNTRAEMARALHYPGDETELHQSFAALRQELKENGDHSAKAPDCLGIRTSTDSLLVANRLFGQKGFEFREPFLALLQQAYEAPLQPMDFVRSPSAATQEINHWVEEQTCRRILNLIPGGELTELTRLVLVNAVYLKASWAKPFPEDETRPQAFHARGTTLMSVPTMRRTATYGFAQQDGFRAVAVPYLGGELQFLILLPDKLDGLAALEARVTPDLLTKCARVFETELTLHLPKFRSEQPLLKLGKVLQSLGMQSAFDKPTGTADFDLMAPRKPEA